MDPPRTSLERAALDGGLGCAGTALEVGFSVPNVAEEQGSLEVSGEQMAGAVDVCAGIQVFDNLDICAPVTALEFATLGRCAPVKDLVGCARAVRHIVSSGRSSRELSPIFKILWPLTRITSPN